MSNPPARLATPDFRQRLPTTNHGPAAHQTREYQSDRASRTACRTATHPADHTPRPTNANARNPPSRLDNALSISGAAPGEQLPPKTALGWGSLGWRGRLERPERNVAAVSHGPRNGRAARGPEGDAARPKRVPRHVRAGDQSTIGGRVSRVRAPVAACGRQSTNPTAARGECAL